MFSTKWKFGCYHIEVSTGENMERFNMSQQSHLKKWTIEIKIGHQFTSEGLLNKFTIMGPIVIIDPYVAVA